MHADGLRDKETFNSTWASNFCLWINPGVRRWNVNCGNHIDTEFLSINRAFLSAGQLNYTNLNLQYHVTSLLPRAFLARIALQQEFAWDAQRVRTL